ncbi:hypothetical protein [Salinivibrio kushneri]|uniref:hypothetical protein n=1 Tax=Salinivibrio kushneri TaxID=1908198 RepID=UPI0022B53AD2|nr:hypothetical protein [Salinivibrio kushneri]WBA17146.1 hypothetical protein O4598_08305 [Salinivibrio kushneri]
MVTIETFSLVELAGPALLIFGLGFILSLWMTRRPHWSFLVAGFKAIFFILYFSVSFDGTFTFLDDWTYLSRGEQLLEMGVSTTNLFAHLPELFLAANRGKHFVYYLYNADTMRVLGAAYYAPVTFNILLTFIAAAFMAAAAKKTLNFSTKLTAAFFVFIALHPDVLAWSTIINGKDTIVLTGTSIIVYSVSLAENKSYLRAGLLAALFTIVLFFTRFYVPVMLLAALLIALFLTPRMYRSLFLWFSLPIGVVGICMVIGTEKLLDIYSRLESDFINPLYGIPRIILTPIPFNTTVHYSFLDVPQVFHWTLIIPMIYGVIRLWRNTHFTARFMVIYFLLMILLYGMYGELQGPRHRYQLDGLIALFQFYGTIGMMKQLLPISSPHIARSSLVTNGPAR